MTKDESGGVETETRHKASYVGAPAIFRLEQACQQLTAAYDHPEHSYGLYMVGSALERPNWRDVDLRLIFSDAYFEEMFPGAGQHWEHDPLWLLLTVSISAWLSQVSGLPIDFQFQPQTHANERHKGRRNAIGLRFKKKWKPSHAD